MTIKKTTQAKRDAVNLYYLENKERIQERRKELRNTTVKGVQSVDEFVEMCRQVVQTVGY